MILAFDTHYREKHAKTVCIAFQNWTDAEPAEVFVAQTAIESDYEPGAFYKRELPCIQHLLDSINLKGVEAIVIDGYVVLDDAGSLGLGGYLYEALQQSIPVIGVAKTNFARNEHAKAAVFRGESQRPLFVTALGVALDVAATRVQHMHGDFRMPTLLQFLDGETKKG
jgi:deoxyribonuclease V